MSYNGWSNYETWLVKLWLDNNENSVALMSKWTEEVRQGTRECQQERMAILVEEHVRSNAPDLGASVYADLLRAALDTVDWNEIAKNILTEN